MSVSFFPGHSIRSVELLATLSVLFLLPCHDIVLSVSIALLVVVSMRSDTLQKNTDPECPMLEGAVSLKSIAGRHQAMHFAAGIPAMMQAAHTASGMHPIARWWNRVHLKRGSNHEVQKPPLVQHSDGTVMMQAACVKSS